MIFINGQPQGQPQQPRIFEYQKDGCRVLMEPTKLGWFGKVINTGNEIIYEHCETTIHLLKRMCDKYLDDKNEPPQAVEPISTLTPETSSVQSSAYNI